MTETEEAITALVEAAPAARRLNILPDYLRTLAIVGKVPALRLGRTVLFDVDAARDALRGLAREGFAIRSLAEAREMRKEAGVDDEEEGEAELDSDPDFQVKEPEPATTGGDA